MIKVTLFLLIIFSFETFSQTDSVITYFNNGNIESIVHFSNGVRDGGAKFFWENGNIKQELSYFNGRVNGLVRNYNEDGVLREMYSIENGKREGPTSYFDSTGTYIKDVFYAEGMLDVKAEPLTYSKQDNVVTNSNESGNNIKKTITQKKINTDPKMPPPSTEKERDLEEDPAFYLSVEVMPEPIGGMDAIYKKLSYPKRAKEDGIEGTVIVRAFIDRDGEVLDAQVVKGIGYGCDESARLAIFYHRFKPGLQRGQRVKVQMDIPVEFKLDKKEN
jgi:TonB family protein